ncbi:Actin cytoplasmic, partial [Taenia solium]
EETHLRPNEYFDSTSRTSPHRMRKRLENEEPVQQSIPSCTEDMLRRYSIFVEENLFKSKSHQNLLDENEVYRKYSVPVEFIRRGSLSRISDDGDNFFDQLNAYVRSKEKENGVTHHSPTKAYPVNVLNWPMKSTGRGPYMTPTPEQEYSVSPQVITPRPRTEPDSYQKTTSFLSAEVNTKPPPQSPAHISPPVGCNSNSEGHIYPEKIRDSPMKSTVESPCVTPASGPKYNVSPQAIPPRSRIEPKFYQEPPVIENFATPSVISSFTTKQINKKPTPFPSVEEKAKLSSYSPMKLVTRMDTNSTNQSPISDKKIIVIDIGHYYVRAGVLRDGTAKPDLCLPNMFGVTSNGFLLGDAAPQITDAEFAENLGGTSVISPLRRSQITTPVSVKNVLIEKEFFLTILRRLNLHENGKGFKLLLCLPTRASALRPYFIDYFLGPTAADEGFGIVEAVATISAFRAALQTSKVSTCLVISLSADLEIIPLAEGRLVEHGRSTIALYGEEALRSLMEEMVKENIDLSKQEIECFGHYIYREAAFVENKATKCHDVVIDLSQYAPYPVNKRISVPAELRRKASDALLRPEQGSTYDGELPSFKTLLNRAIQSCDVDLRSAICSNVLLIGEFAGIEGLRERVSEEMQVFLPEGASPSTVQVAKNTAGLAYEGACLLYTVLQGPQPPRCPWFRFVDAKAWSSMLSEVGCSASFSGTRLLDRLNRDCLWP